MTQLLSFSQVGLLSSTQRILSGLALRDVIIGLKRPEGSPAVVPLERPTACDGDLRSVALRVKKLALPAPGAEQRFCDLLKRNGEDRTQKLMSDLA